MKKYIDIKDVDFLDLCGGIIASIAIIVAFFMSILLVIRFFI